MYFHRCGTLFCICNLMKFFVKQVHVRGGVTSQLKTKSCYCHGKEQGRVRSINIICGIAEISTWTYHCTKCRCNQRFHHHSFFIHHSRPHTHTHTQNSQIKKPLYWRHCWCHRNNKLNRRLERIKEIDEIRDLFLQLPATLMWPSKCFAFTRHAQRRDDPINSSSSSFLYRRNSIMEAWSAECSLSSPRESRFKSDQSKRLY